MLYFSISNSDNRHLGFLVLMDEEDSTYADGAVGYYAIKAQADEIEQLACTVEWQILSSLSQQGGLKWHKKKDNVQLCDIHHKIIGQLQQQHLILQGVHFLLNDLTGTL
jgi:hypothetical protein